MERDTSLVPTEIIQPQGDQTQAMPEAQLEIPEEKAAQTLNPAEQLNTYLGMLPEQLHGGYLKRYEDAIANPDAVSGITKVKGLLFEVSRICKVINEGKESVDFGLMDEPPKVTYLGFPKKGADMTLPPHKELTSSIDIDVPISREGEPYVYEAKSSTRRSYGALPEQRNQLLKYQTATETGQIKGATIELNGIIDPEFLAWATGDGIDDLGPIPNVEIVYTLPLPSGGEYRFVLKRGSGNSGLQFENPQFEDPRDGQVIKGVHKAILDRSIVSLLTAKPQGASEELQPYIDNPTSIDSPEVYDEFDSFYKQTLYQRLSDKADQVVNISNELAAYSEAATPIFVEQTLREVQDYLRQNPDATKAQKGYLLSGEEIPIVLAEVMQRIEMIRSKEAGRIGSQQEHSRHEARSAMGYAVNLPAEGTALNVEHVIMDSIQSVKKGDESRIYDKPERFATVEELHEYLASALDRTYREVTIYDPVSGKTEVHKDVSEQGYEKKQAALLKTNITKVMEVLGYVSDRHSELSAQPARTNEEEAELLRLGAPVRGLTQQGEKIKRIETTIAELETSKAEEIKAAENSAKGAIRERYDAQINGNHALLQEILIPVVGGKGEWDKLAQQVIEDKTQNLIKFIYTVDAEGTVRVDEEKFRGKVTGRAAHSELAGGKNVYGAGELIFTKIDGSWQVTELNNGSGHYRPSALTLPYVAKVLEAKGFDTHSARMVDSLQRGAQLAEASFLDA